MLFFLYIINLILALLLIFYKNRDTSVTWAWLLVFIFIPYIGFILYLFLGMGLTQFEKFNIKKQMISELQSMSKDMDGMLNLYTLHPNESDHHPLTTFMSNLNNRPLTHHNDVQLITDGRQKIDTLKQDILNAKSFIHVEYYSFIADEIGLEVLDVLTQKAREGIDVYLLYDEWGSKYIKQQSVEDFKNAGGKIQKYITSQKAIRKLQLNYHNHRKIVIIDGNISYIGGFNIGNQYVNTTQKFGYWRDTHLRILGPATSVLELRFIADWNVSVSENEWLSFNTENIFNQLPDTTANTDIQIITSGPHDEQQQIKLAFNKVITNATKRLWIQTPYLVPDDTVIDSLVIAKKSGVDVKIMIPNKPDHPFIYRATEFYAQILVNHNIEVYIYDGGFLHAKTLIMDDDVAIVGSANQDIRSYKLNFEASAVLYDCQFNEKLAQQFNQDLEHSTRMDQAFINQMSLWLKFKQKTARLLSPIM